MEQLDVFQRMNEIGLLASSASELREMTQLERRIHEHKAWLQMIRHERPNTERPYRIGVYIRYFNQTKYENYLDYHKKQFADAISLCPKWTLVDFYVDVGASAPRMERAPAWKRLLDDCTEGKVDLIITQKVSNVSKRPFELTFCARLLAALDPPIGIYFVSEDIFTLASYYQEDLRDPFFLPSPDWLPLPDEDTEQGG